MKHSCYDNSNFVCNIPPGEIGDLLLTELKHSFKRWGYHLRRFRRVTKGEVWGWAVYIRSDRNDGISRLTTRG